MKKVLSLMIVSVLALSLAGCQGKEQPVDTIKTPPVVEVGDKTGDVPKGITVNEIKFERVVFENLSEDLVKMLEESKVEKGYKLIKDESSDYYYLAVFSGEKPSTGYGIEIVSVEDNEGKTIVSALEYSPSPDSMNATVLTYPMDIVKITGITENVEVNFTQVENEVDPNTPVDDGTDSSTFIETEIITATYEGQIDANSIEVKVDGEVRALRLRDISAEELKNINPEVGSTIKIEIFKDNGQDTVYAFLVEPQTSGKKAIQTVPVEYVGRIDVNSIEVKIEDGPTTLRLTDMAKDQLDTLDLKEGDIIILDVFNDENNQQTVQYIQISE